MEGKVHTVTFGVNTQMSEVKYALRDCMQSGYWLVLQNAHLSEAWGQELMQLIKVSYYLEIIVVSISHK